MIDNNPLSCPANVVENCSMPAGLVSETLVSTFLFAILFRQKLTLMLMTSSLFNHHQFEPNHFIQMDQWQDCADTSSVLVNKTIGEIWERLVARQVTNFFLSLGPFQCFRLWDPAFWMNFLGKHLFCMFFSPFLQTILLLLAWVHYHGMNILKK